MYHWQDKPVSLDAYSDSDWGGDLVTRRSTSGGCILRGDHLLMHWSRTQQVVSLSSAEAELVAGYNVEYSSVTFAMFFLGEYSNMIIMSALNVIFFFGG